VCICVQVMSVPTLRRGYENSFGLKRTDWRNVNRADINFVRRISGHRIFDHVYNNTIRNEPKPGLKKLGKDNCHTYLRFVLIRIHTSWSMWDLGFSWLQVWWWLFSALLVPAVRQVYRRFRGAWCLHHQDLDDGSSKQEHFCRLHGARAEQTAIYNVAEIRG
jgi:hypothetical protein